MERMVWSTEGVPEPERFDFWREASRAAFGIRIEPGPAADAAAPFRGRIDAWAAAGVHGYRMRADAFAVFRSRQEIARRPWDACMVFREAGGGTRFDFAGRELVDPPGDLVVADADLLFTAAVPERHACDIWLLPRALLEPRLGQRFQPLSLRLPGRDGLGALLSTYLDALTAQLPGLEGPTAAAVVDNLCRLVAIGCDAVGPAAETGREAVRAARVERAKRYVERHLAEPDLSPARVARALGISVRQLHLDFEPTGESFARHVRRRRLEECRAALLGPGGADRPVTDVAFAWGFDNLATFYRVFRDAFGVAPGELRAAARGR